MSFIMQINVDLIYPIGSIYMTTSTVSPAVLFGGTWERIKGRCIVGVDESDANFNIVSKTGGEKTHKLTVEEMPKHSHSILFMDTTTGSDSFVQAKVGGNLYGYNDRIGEKGGDGSHNNLQPYYTAYIWRRTA